MLQAKESSMSAFIGLGCVVRSSNKTPDQVCTVHQSIMNKGEGFKILEAGSGLELNYA